MAQLTDRMPQVTIVFGIVFILLGVGGYFGSGAASATALIPAIFGALFVVLGAIARNERYLKHTMHATAVLALLAAGGAFRGVTALPSLFDGTAERPMAVAAQVLMVVLAIVYLVLCVRSFIEARRARAA
ncbi:MAG: hypothetical protein AAGC60_28075 [Acidobacteriota bacterium]